QLPLLVGERLLGSGGGTLELVQLAQAGAELQQVSEVVLVELLAVGLVCQVDAALVLGEEVGVAAATLDLIEAALEAWFVFRACPARLLERRLGRVQFAFRLAGGGLGIVQGALGLAELLLAAAVAL